MSLIRLAKPSSKPFHLVLVFYNQSPQSDRCELLLNVPEGGIQEVASSLAANKEISVEAVVAAVSS